MFSRFRNWLAEFFDGKPNGELGEVIDDAAFDQLVKDIEDICRQRGLRFASCTLIVGVRDGETGHIAHVFMRGHTVSLADCGATMMAGVCLSNPIIGVKALGEISEKILQLKKKNPA